MINHSDVLRIVQAQLAVELNCTVEDLDGPPDSIVFVAARDNPGRRPFRRGERFFEIVSMGRSIVVSATPERLAIARAMMQGKDRDTVFAMPFIRGLSLNYLPDLKVLQPLSPPKGFEFELVPEERAAGLLTIAGFGNAIIYDPDHPYRTDLAVLATKQGQVVGVAGASQPCAKLMQVGVDVLPAYRGMRLAVYLVNRLTYEILGRDCVPLYGTIASNLASQRVAHRAGYYVAWVSDWRCNFEALESVPSTQ